MALCKNKKSFNTRESGDRADCADGGNPEPLEHWLVNDDYPKYCHRIGCHFEFGILSALGGCSEWGDDTAQAYSGIHKNLCLYRDTKPDTHLDCGSVTLNQRQGSGLRGTPSPRGSGVEGTVCGTWPSDNRPGRTFLRGSEQVVGLVLTDIWCFQVLATLQQSFLLCFLLLLFWKMELILHSYHPGRWVGLCPPLPIANTQI